MIKKITDFAVRLNCVLLIMLCALIAMPSCGGSQNSSSSETAENSGSQNGKKNKKQKTEEEEEYDEDEYEDDDEDDDDEYDDDEDGSDSDHSWIYEQKIGNAADKKVSATMDANLEPIHNTWNIGSAKKLEGKIYVLEVWMTSPGTSWSKNNIADMQGKIYSALDWLKKIAAKYGKNVEFEIGSYGVGAEGNEPGVIVENLPQSYEDVAYNAPVLPEALKTIGYPDVLSCYNYLKEDFGTDNIVLLQLINNDGWPCACNFSKGYSEYNGEYDDFYLESVNIFRTMKGEQCKDETIAHELLHCFGAWDMYGGQVTKEAAQWAQTYYPNEIMLGAYDLKSAVVSPLTAYLTGLSTEYNDWYLYFTRVDNPAMGGESVD